MANSNNTNTIEAVITDWSDGITNKDARRTLSHLTDDIVEFSLAPPLQYNGKDAEGIQGWFDTWIGSIGNEARELHITASEDIGFARSLVRMTGTKITGENVDLWFRQTLGLVKQEGIWKIAHTHASVPFHMDGSFKAAIDLTP